MIMRRTRHRLTMAFLLAVAAMISGGRAMSAETAVTTITLSPDAPARLVLDYWPIGGWLVRQSGRQVELSLQGVRLAVLVESISLPAADGAISTLATEISGDVTLLRIGLGCDCILALQGDGSQLLIDVVAAVNFAEAVVRDAEPAPKSAPVPQPRRGEGVVAISPTDGQRVEETRTRLLDELRRAADAGLVTLRPDASGSLAQAIERPAENEHPAESDEPVEPEANEQAMTAVDDPTGRPDIEAHPGEPVVEAAVADKTARDGATDNDHRTKQPAAPNVTPPISDDVAMVAVTPATPTELVEVAAAGACLPNEAFHLADPLSAVDLIAEVSELRRALVGEFDQVDTPTALTLARLYLAHGLGTEALDVLTVFVPDAAEAYLLAALATLAEGKSLPAQNVLQVPGCTGQHALWQALDAALAQRPDQAIALEAMAAGALEQTARGLRGQIAVQLGLAAIAGRDWNAAYRLNAMAKRAIARDDRESQEMRSLLEAHLRFERGDDDAALARLAALRGARSPAGASAVLLLAELAATRADGTGVQPEQLRIDLGALALEQRDTPLGERAFLREVELAGHYVGKDVAFELLAYGHAGRVISDRAYREALAVLGANLTEKPDDTPLALIYEADPQRFAQSLGDPAFRTSLARSYISLGAPSLGENVLDSGDLEDLDLLEDFARSYLEIGDSEAATRFADKLPEGPGRAGVEAGVARALGDASVALERLVAAGAPAVKRARTAWAAGDWPASVRALEQSIAERGIGAEQSSATSFSPVETKDVMPTASLAVRLALAARHSGQATLPLEVLSVTQDQPGLQAGLQAILAPMGEGPVGASPGMVATYLESVSAEARLFEGILNDG